MGVCRQFDIRKQVDYASSHVMPGWKTDWFFRDENADCRQTSNVRG